MAITNQGVPYNKDEVLEDSEDSRRIVELAYGRLKITYDNYKKNITPAQLCCRRAIILSSGAAGAGMGAGVGVAISGPAAPGSIVIGSLVGGLIGMLLAYLGVICKNATEFQDWKKKQSEPLERSFLDFFQNEPALQFCVDETFSMSIIEEPVCDPCGHTFDLVNIREHLKKKNQWEGDLEPIGHCPISRRPLKEEDLRVDYYTMGLMNQAFIVVLQDKSGNMILSDLVRQGITFLQNDMETRSRRCFDLEMNILKKLQKKGKISQGEFDKRIECVAAQLQIDKSFRIGC